MAQSLMVIATEPGTGKSVLSLGLTDQFERHGMRATYFKPVSVASDATVDRDVQFIHRALKMAAAPEAMVGVDTEVIRQAISAGRYDAALDTILERHASASEGVDVLICEGVDSLGVFPALEGDINVDIARNIDAPVLLVTTARDRSIAQVIEIIRLTVQALRERGARVLGSLINHVPQRQHAEFSDVLRREFGASDAPVFGLLPEIPVLSSPRVRDVVRDLEARVLLGGLCLDARVSTAVIAAMGLENALHHFEPNNLIITPGDREEILLAAAAIYTSDVMPSPAGVLLTGGFAPRRRVMELVRGLTQGKLPVLSTDRTTYDTAIAVDRVQPVLEEDQEDKALAIRHAMEEHLDLDRLFRGRVAPQRRITTPKRFLRQLRDKARAQKRTIVLPESDVDRILKAAGELRRMDAVDVVLIGKDSEVRQRAARIGVRLDEGVTIVDPATDPAYPEYVQTLLELRKHKGLVEGVARDLMRDRTHFATMMVYQGRAHGMVSGATTTTQATIRPAFQIIRTQEGFRSVSSVFFMLLPERVLVYGDCAIIPEPTVEQLAEIAISSAETARAFGIEPRVAMLSYSTGASGKGAAVDKVRAATALVHERRPDLLVEGPIQYDAAIDPGVARTKLPESDVAGQANVFIFPDLNTGNNTYKAVQRSSGAIAVGPVLQGLRQPVNDLSRGATVTDIVNTVIVTAIQAQEG